MTRFPFRAAGAAALAVTVAAGLAACGGDDDAPPVAADPFVPGTQVNVSATQSADGAFAFANGSVTPDNTGEPLLLGAGKDGNIYWMSGTGGLLGEYNGTTNGNARTLTGALPDGATSSPAFFNGSFFYGGSNDAVKAFGIISGGTVSGGTSPASRFESRTSAPVVFAAESTGFGCTGGSAFAHPAISTSIKSVFMAPPGCMRRAEARDISADE